MRSEFNTLIAYEHGEGPMSWKLKFVTAILMLTQSVAIAMAHDCLRGACFFSPPPYYAKPVRRLHFHHFHPQPWDGLPVVDGFHHELDSYHAVDCIWTRHLLPTPNGPAWGLVRDCLSY